MSAPISRNRAPFLISRNRAPFTLTDLVADLLANETDVFDVDAIVELVVLPSSERRQADKKAREPYQHEHQQNPLRRSILHIADVRDRPVPECELMKMRQTG